MNTIGTTPRTPIRTLLCTGILSALLALAGASCGQSGPLYLPRSEPAAATATETQTDKNDAEATTEATEAEVPGPTEEDIEETP